ncbi:hypothetical protein MTR67_052408 [Solanum verrucosum]|uniref:Uncharacterized protein n=1 Tax=Solanum verrucosum TaxID=315347 RepID=A0AAF0V961_SOLVR|nr:hypothetical protein MTR67_052408 [Solanum verrucosum]
MLKKCVGDPSLITPTENIGIKENLSYEKTLVHILDRQVRKLRTKEVSSTKVLWRNQFVEEATLESEEDIKKRYPHLFPFEEILDQGVSLYFVTPYLAMRFHIVPEQLLEPFNVSTPMDGWPSRALHLDPRGHVEGMHHGFQRISKRVGNITYELELQLELAKFDLVFHISMLKKCLGDPSLIVPTENISIKDNLSYEEVPI